MEKRKLSVIPRESADADMLQTAHRLGGMSHMVTARLIENNKILLLNFFEIEALREGKTEAAFRTFLSDSDYITQDLKVSNVKWLTAAFAGMRGFCLWDHVWDPKIEKWMWKENVFIRSAKDMKIIGDFFRDYADSKDEGWPWSAIDRFQDKVKEKRLDAKHKKETDVIDAVMAPIRQVPERFFDWVWEHGMSFSRYLIYKEEEKGKAVCECTHCKKIGVVDRKEIRLRNNEKGICPFCGSRVTVKARGRMPAQIFDERWFLYVDSMGEGFVLRYFKATRRIRNDAYIDMLINNKDRVEQSIFEYSRVICSFPNGKVQCVPYEWGVYKQRGLPRWCPDNGNINCLNCILYPENLPQAWEHTPMKYSALEVLSANIPTVSLCYENAMKKYLKFPKLEWLCKMGLNNLVKNIINDYGYSNGVTGKVNYSGGTIYEILGLTKINTRILQAMDGDHNALRLLQVSQQIGFQFKPERLREYYETFGCNTELLKQANRKVSLHKLVKYITKESERYPLGSQGGCWQYSYMRYTEREDPRVERKRNMAKDWLEYLGWCKALKYDLDNMFIYMPTNFKKVHDRTAEEYQALQDKKAAAEKKRQEDMARKHMEQTRKAMEALFKKNEEMDAFSIKGFGLVLVVPRNGEEIKTEGATLHHCVGGYVERVAKGETSIYFIRKAEAPETPYFTMEYRDNHVTQCRGYKNCGMPPKVEAFVKVFEKKLQDSMRQEKSEKKHRKAG
ncbi:MAG: hypothetical protein HFI89_06290 [Lachnospiraceae bacterium]|nr:hypothetical protein [Lachnospiraceae bacterium]